MSTLKHCKQYPLKEIRNEIFKMISEVGRLSSCCLQKEAMGIVITTNKVIQTIKLLLEHILTVGTLLSLSVVKEIEKKMHINRAKYPVHLAKGKIKKHTEFSKHTGITKEHDGQEYAAINKHEVSVDNYDNLNDFINNIPLLKKNLHDFSEEREWNTYNTFRNLVLALTGEVGELAGLVHFKGDVTNYNFTENEMINLGQEVADVTIYLLRLTDIFPEVSVRLMLSGIQHEHKAPAYPKHEIGKAHV